MVYTLVLEASAARIESSSLSLRTKFSTTPRRNDMQYNSRGTTIDTEKCVENIDNNRYLMVIVASLRAREIAVQNRHSDRFEHWHTPVTALLEIQEGKLDLTSIKRLK